MPKGDKDLLKADTDDGYTPIANLILEALALAKLSGVQKGICLFLFRRTYGWGQKEDAITLSEFAQACGTSPAYVSRQLKQLIEWNVVLRTSYQPGKTPVYTFNTRVALWYKGCINVQGLHERLVQGLYKCATPPLHKCERVVEAQTLGATGTDGSPKESIKDSIKTDTSPYGDGGQAAGEDGAKGGEGRVVPLKQERQPKAPKKPRTSPEAKQVVERLKACLTACGVDHLPRDWHLKNYAVADRIIRSGVSPGELLACIDWLFGDAYWQDKVTDMLTVERQYPKFKLRERGGLGGDTNGSSGAQHTRAPSGPEGRYSEYDAVWTRAPARPQGRVGP